MSKLQPVRGTQDITGDDARRFARVVEAFYRVAGTFGFERISTPIFEFTEVFKRPLGVASDIVSKEMYTFTDRGGEEITLRPENTASIARAYLSEGMQQKGVVKLAAHGPMFRYERPQKGRYRQFHQLDAEIIGAPDPGADVDIIALGHQVLVDLGIEKSTKLHLNTLGDTESRAAFRAAFVNFLEAKKANLSKDSQERLKTNPLRILDSKDPGDQELLNGYTPLWEFLNENSKDFFEEVKKGLDTLGIKYFENPRLVRGLDYYCHTAFEFITEDLGAQGSVIGGGRYDGLIQMMGGPATPGTGWAGGIERLAMLLENPPPLPRPVIFVPITDEAGTLAAKLCHDLRKSEISADMAYRGNLKKRLQKANKANARFAVIIGDDEMAAKKLTVRDLDSGDQSQIDVGDLIAFLKKQNTN